MRAAGEAAAAVPSCASRHGQLSVVQVAPSDGQPRRLAMPRAKGALVHAHERRVRGIQCALQRGVGPHVARERLHFCPSDRTFKVFRCLFGRDPDALEKASLMRDAIPEKAGEFRTFNQGFVEAVAVCPLIGDRSAPFDTD